MSGSMYNKIYVLIKFYSHFGCFPTKILLLYIKINNQGVCKTFFQADTFTVSIVTNDLWLDPFCMSLSMYNKIYVVD